MAPFLLLEKVSEWVYFNSSINGFESASSLDSVLETESKLGQRGLWTEGRRTVESNPRAAPEQDEGTPRGIIKCTSR